MRWPFGTFSEPRCGLLRAGRFGLRLLPAFRRSAGFLDLATLGALGPADTPARERTGEVVRFSVGRAATPRGVLAQRPSLRSCAPMGSCSSVPCSLKPNGNVWRLLPPCFARAGPAGGATAIAVATSDHVGQRVAQVPLPPAAAGRQPSAVAAVRRLHRASVSVVALAARVRAVVCERVGVGPAREAAQRRTAAASSLRRRPRRRLLVLLILILLPPVLSQLTSIAAALVLVLVLARCVGHRLLLLLRTSAITGRPRPCLRSRPLLYTVLEIIVLPVLIP